MNYIKLFDSFGQSEATVEDVTDIFNNVSDNYDCDIKIRLDSSDPLFGKFSPTSRYLKTNRWEAISSIISKKTGEIISPKFIESYVSNYYDYSGREDIKKYHQHILRCHFSTSKKYSNDIKLIHDYHDSSVFIIETFSNDRSLLEYDWSNEIGMMKSIWGLDLISEERNHLRILFLFA